VEDVQQNCKGSLSRGYEGNVPNWLDFLDVESGHVRTSFGSRLLLMSNVVDTLPHRYNATQ
jgi:hypothetical protein